MAYHNEKRAARHAEAQRLIDMARRTLDQPEEEIVVDYLDHAASALRMLAEEAQPPPH